jgi:hypothetical protein
VFGCSENYFENIKQWLRTIFKTVSNLSTNNCIGWELSLFLFSSLYFSEFTAELVKKVFGCSDNYFENIIQWSRTVSKAEQAIKLSGVNFVTCVKTGFLRYPFDF